MRSSTLLWVAAVAILATAMLASLLAGHVWLSPADVIAGLSKPNDQLSNLIVFELRMPRAILAVLVGAALGLSGAVLQGLLRNPLAEPGLLGVSGGASLGAVVAIYFGISSSFALATPLMGMIFAMAAGALTFAVGRGAGAVSLILAGAAVSALVGSGVALALNFAPSPYAAYEITTWLLGSLSNRSWDHVLLAGPFIVAGGVMLAFTGRALDALALGEAQAQSLGVDLTRTRLFALLGTGLAVGAATSVTGAIGFIGLVAPHLVRPFVGHQPSRTLAPAALVGAALLLITDIATRLIPSGLELRLGVLTSLIGLPFFFWLVIKMKRTTP
jgi:iron complex transport system permease protein